MSPSARCCLPQRMWAMEATLGGAGVLACGFFFCFAGDLWRFAVEAEVGVVRLWSAVTGMLVVLLRLKMGGLSGLKVLGAFALESP